MTEQKCITELCQNDSTTRGLCYSCYGVARTAVSKNITTWAELESNGLCKEATKKKGGNSLFMQAFKKKLNK